MATLAAEAQGEIRTHATVVRSQGQGLAERRLRLGVTTMAAESEPELVTELAVDATDRDRLPQRGSRAGIITERSQRLAVSGMKVGIDRVEAQRLGVRRRLLGKATLATIDRTERAIGRGLVRTQTQV